MLALYHPPTRVLYAADLLLYNDRTRRFRVPMPVDHHDAYVATMRRLRDLDVRWVLVAHGGIVRLADPSGPITTEASCDVAAGQGAPVRPGAPTSTPETAADRIRIRSTLDKTWRDVVDDVLVRMDVGATGRTATGALINFLSGAYVAAEDFAVINPVPLAPLVEDCHPVVSLVHRTDIRAEQKEVEHDVPLTLLQRYAILCGQRVQKYEDEFEVEQRMAEGNSADGASARPTSR
jgi:hypothetical protein